MRLPVDLPASWRSQWQWIAMLLLFLLAGVLHAQDASADDNADPPTRVARLSYVSGDLGFLPAGASDWSDASINRPLTTGDRLSTGQGSRAELELGGGSLRMASRTEFGVLELSDRMAQFELTEGTLNITVRNLDDGQSYEIDTPTVALVIDQPGTFRVDIQDDGGSPSTRVTAFDGRATVYGENNAQRTVLAGRTYRFVDASLAAVSISDIGGGDAFDAWASERDNSYAQSDASRYVGDDVVGYQDLDQYGQWQDTDDYGAVWFPTGMAADWAPYRDGYWAYIAPWGWTWVDNSPWGFAPYHYGRWAYVRGGWGWIPGPRGVRAVYAPALVAFVGGGGWSVGIGGGPVGWFPLGPGEIYNPWYRCGRSCYTNVNYNNMRGWRGGDRAGFIAHIHDRYANYRRGTPLHGEHYANRDAPRGFTAVPGRAFASGQNVRRDVLHVDPHQLAGASVSMRGAGMRPTPGALAGPRSPHARSLPPPGLQRDVVARHAPIETSAASRYAGARNTLAASAAANVHVLDNHGSARDTAAPTSDRFSHGFDSAASASHGLPAVPRVNSGTPADVGHQPLDRRGAFPSSRYAHSQPENDMARPQGSGEGTISGAGHVRESYRGPTTLPQAPQIQREQDMRQPAPENMQPRRFDRGNDAMHMPEHPVDQPARQNYQPRYEPQRQNFQPRYEPQRSSQDFRPQPRGESHEQYAAPARESHSNDRGSSKDDSRGH